ncbi:hypothetical protein [Aquabacterium sp. OR-4]|uniref:hypothetical protein n=1 Tax=Aquabacterium sp. OR-4 TaxID=2978127 RepID=UPI0028C74B2F|nr:hypothetical protein [Aquabacterium sp. OR-4]MDT7838934.1 hypothetical protein [Aquabacterium sp. OR-4]
MTFTKIVSAVALMAAGSAFAASPVAQIGIASGASASKGNLKVALASLCPAPAQFVEFVGSSNISTYFCGAAGSFASTSAPTAAEYTAATAVKFTGTQYSELRLNVAGGSFTAACLLAGWPAGTACPAEDTYRDPATGTNVLRPAGSVVVGGLMDVEPNGFLGTVRNGVANPASNVSAGFAQTFGVAVSPELYQAMFDDQLSTGKVAAGCLVTDTKKAECVPVIGKAQMAAIMSGNTGSDAYTRGANLLAPSILASGTALTYARRVDTSGTQAVAQQYFLGNVCNGAAVGVVPEGGSAGAITVTALAGTGDVRALLRGTGYVVGVMSGENNQSEAWRWVRVGGMAMADSAQPAEAGVSFTNTATAKDGTYDMWFVSRIAQPAASGNPATFWTRVRTALNTSIATGNTKGLFAVSETKFSKGTSSNCTPVAQ